MKPDRIGPKLRPDAPLVQCDCETGRNTCTECGGSGRLCAADRHGYDEWACEMCRGRGSVLCVTCEGEGSYPDPNATLECPNCGEWIDAETDACLSGCGYVWRAA